MSEIKTAIWAFDEDGRAVLLDHLQTEIIVLEGLIEYNKHKYAMLLRETNMLEAEMKVREKILAEKKARYDLLNARHEKYFFD